MYRKCNKELEIIGVYLGDYDREFYLRELSRLAKMPLRTTQNLLSVLEKNDIIKSKERGKHKYFRLNLDNIHTKFRLLQAEIDKTSLFLDKYPVFKTFLKEVKGGELLIVFGGFAKFKAGKDSDLDLLIVTKKSGKLPLHLLPYKIHDLDLSEDSFINSVKKRETLIKEIEENHIILNNHSLFVNVMWDYYEK